MAQVPIQGCPVFNWAALWPRAEVLRLRRDNERLSVALKNATEKAAESLTRLDELREQKCSACENLKQVLNFHVYAAGSKVPMFDGYGPTLPVRPEHKEDPVAGPQRASRVARAQRQDFLNEFIASELQSTVEGI